MAKILITTPRFPYPEAGADEQDRAEGIRQLKRLGYEVRVVAKCFDWQPKEEIVSAWLREGVLVTLVPYQKPAKGWSAFGGKKFSWIFDGAAAEYADPVMQKVVEQEFETWKPEIVCFDYTYLWPLYHLVKKRNIPIVVRSINVESRHFLEEDGRTPLNYLKFVPKYVTEKITGRGADVLFSITPYEKELYEKMGARHVVNLPLRALWKKLGTHTPRETAECHAFFSGSTYTVAHNYRALKFLVEELAPAIFRRCGPAIQFHVTGAKFPKDLEPCIRDNVVYDGFVSDMDAYLADKDIAVVPSFFGAGMQQKIFEPLARGFPTITHGRGIAGYPFVDGEDYVRAETLAEYADALDGLRSIDKRRPLSENCKSKSVALFNQPTIDNIVYREFEQLKSIKLKR